MLSTCFIIILGMGGVVQGDKIALQTDRIIQVTEKRCAPVRNNSRTLGEKRWTSIEYDNGTEYNKSFCVKLEFDQVIKKIEECKK